MLSIIHSVPSLLPQLFTYQELAPLLMRLVLAAVFIAHGHPKLFKDLSGTALFLESLGFKPAKFWAIVLGGVEFFGGIMLFFGVATQLAASLIAVVMVAAILVVKRKQGLVGLPATSGSAAQAGGYEFELALLAIALALLILGPGAFAIDAKF